MSTDTPEKTPQQPEHPRIVLRGAMAWGNGGDGFRIADDSRDVDLTDTMSMANGGKGFNISEPPQKHQDDNRSHRPRDWHERAIGKVSMGVAVGLIVAICVGLWHWFRS